ncbi:MULTISPECIES: hypothetical protein [unclassified Azospirillum]|uniref:hypothetical protein n=1 Tax=unclassified Azospirillum TaxID=2630922 RepID=UPI000D61FD5B|nr:hypothetical protein [Azospirillum sp. TSO22-1]PWC52334.1 hypothetical protein TSO221_14820 [Azospirillum sp. TSO22-1]
MDLTPAVAPFVAKPQQPITPAAQAALSPAMAAAQQTVHVVRTQTIQAPQATGKTEGSRDTRTGTETGQSVDPGAGAVTARANGAHHQPRGSLLDVHV